jgi:hypothetical protein
VHNVGTIEALAAGDKKLGCNEFFGRQNFDRNAQDLSLAGAVDPFATYGNHCVTHTGDKVYEEFSTMDFAEPHLIAYLGFKARGVKYVERTGYLFAR